MPMSKRNRSRSTPSAANERPTRRARSGAEPTTGAATSGLAGPSSAEPVTASSSVVNDLIDGNATSVFDASGVATSLAAADGICLEDPLSSNATMQRLLRFSQAHGDIDGGLDLPSAQALLSASYGGTMPPEISARIASMLSADGSGVSPDGGGAASANNATGPAANAAVVDGAMRDGVDPAQADADILAAADAASATAIPEEEQLQAATPVVAPVTTDSGGSGAGGSGGAGPRAADVSEPTVAVGPVVAPASTNSGGGAPPASATAPRTTDPIVDHYMKVHWDQSDISARSAEFGAYPDAIATETDRWLPANASPEVRAGANFLVGLGAGLLDGVFGAFAKSIPGVGAIAELLYGIKDGWKAVADAAANGDVAAAIFEVIRALFDIVGGVSGNLGDLFTYTQVTAHGAAPITVGFSEFVGVPAAVLANGFSTIQSFCHGALPVIDLGLTAYYYVQGQSAEANLQFDRQAWYKERATDSAFRCAASAIQAAAAWISSGTLAGVPGQLPGTWGELLVTTGKKFGSEFGGLVGKTNSMTGSNTFGRFAGEGRAVAGLFQGVTNTSAAMGFSDVMGRTADGFMGAHYIARQNLAASGTAGARIIGAAREQTLADMDAGWESLESDKPQWHQEVINKILSEDAGVSAYDMLNIALSPSEWIRLQFAGMRYVMTALGDGGLEDVATLAGLAETALTGVAQPFINNMSDWFQENKPALDEMVVALNTRIQEQTVSLAAIRGALDQAQVYTNQLGTLADAGGSIDRLFDPMLGTIQGMRISAERLGIPEWVPAFSYQWVIDATNSAVDRGVRMVVDLKNGALSQLDQGLELAQDEITQTITFFQEAFVAGGELETMLQDELRGAQETAQLAAEAWTSWNGDFSVDFNGAGDFFRKIAEKAAANMSSAKQDQWKVYVETVAQAYVDDWKSRHDHEVYENFAPFMPPGEIAAVQEVYQLVSANLDAVGTPASDARRSALNDAYQACLSFNGQQGRDALEGLWAAEERLARIALEPLPVVAPEEVDEPEPEQSATPPTPVRVHFAFDSPGRSGGGIINKSEVALAVALAQNAANARIHIVGHASIEGSDDYNERLGQRRADAVADEIRSEVPGARVATSSAGESAAGQSDSEQRHERWRVAVVSVEGSEG